MAAIEIPAPRRIRLPRLAWIGLAALALAVALTADAREVVREGVPGLDGADGEAGDPGERGSPGFAAKIGSAVARSADPVNRAVADGRGTSGGQGGSGGPGSPEGEDDEDAAGGEGADGGSAESAVATAITDWTQGIASGDPVKTEAHATAAGAGGGAGGAGGTGAGDGADGKAGNGAAGASASATAESANLNFNSEATARAGGGAGGGAVRDGNGGRGGPTTALARASTTGDGDVSVDAVARGGGGGTVRGVGSSSNAGIGGAGGSGSANAFATAVRGDAKATARGDGGTGGSGGSGGAAGSGSATAIARNSGPGSVEASARASGGGGGRGKATGSAGAGASASAQAISSGGGDAKVRVNAGGGSGAGGGGAITLNNAAVVRTTGRASLQQVARGGSGRRGSSGGSAESTVDFTHQGLERINVDVAANGGSGGASGGRAKTAAKVISLGPIVISGTSRGGAGGAGGLAELGDFFAESKHNDDVTIRVRSSAGSGSRPSEAHIDNVVGGKTRGRLRLEQRATGGNNDTRAGQGADASNRLQRSHDGERLYLMAESKGGDGHEGGGGGDARVTLGGSNSGGELILRGEALGGAAGTGDASGAGGTALLEAAATAPAGAGKVDIRVESTGGPGAKGSVELSREDAAKYGAARSEGIDWAEQFGIGGDALSRVTVESAASEDVAVQSDAAAGSARPEGVLPANGGFASSEVTVRAEQAPRLQIDSNARGGDARLDAEAGAAESRAAGFTRNVLQVHAKALSGAGPVFALADAQAQGAAAEGSLSARAETRTDQRAVGLNWLATSIQAAPQNTYAFASGQSPSALGLHALAGSTAEDPLEPAADQTPPFDAAGTARVVPYPQGEADSLFAFSVAVRHPLSAGEAERYRQADSPAIRQLLQPVRYTAELHWPSGVLPPFVIRGTRGQREGDQRMHIVVTGLHDGGELGRIVVDDGDPSHAFEGIFLGEWRPDGLLRDGPGGQSMSGLRLTMELAPGGEFDARLVIVR
ncbi:MAG: hypothetical protein U5Q16_10730 [Gammaproteobacteria bacterium]|nr:hypothetical protein [Gammaproteobacteria bacterium]